MNVILRRRVMAASCAFLVASSFAVEARANGRYPATNQFVFSPIDPDQLVLRVTFGLLVSRDHGKTWRWVCERALGIVGDEDPMYTITPTGALVSTTIRGVEVSRDEMCTFPPAPGVPRRAFVDLTARRAAPSEVVVFASDRANDGPDGKPVHVSELFETLDEARSFTSLGSPFPDTSFAGETVDLAPSDRDRIYVTGVREKGLETRSARLFTSRDRGKTWSGVDVPLVGTETSLYIAGVDPSRADRLYLRTSNGFEQPTRVLVSDDGGATTRTIFSATGAVPGFALSEDGSRIWVGGPLDGLHVASTADFAFAQRTKIEIQCLATSPDGLLACSNERFGFVAGLSTDDGATFSPMLRFCNILGPLMDCPDTSATSYECVAGGKLGQPPWPFQRMQLACDLPDGGGRRDASTPGSGDVGVDTSPPDEGCAAAPAREGAFSAFALGGLATIAVLILRRRRRLH